MSILREELDRRAEWNFFPKLGFRSKINQEHLAAERLSPECHMDEGTGVATTGKWEIKHKNKGGRKQKIAEGAVFPSRGYYRVKTWRAVNVAVCVRPSRASSWGAAIHKSN